MFKINLLSIKRNLQSRDKIVFNNLFTLTKNAFTKLNVNILIFEKQLTLIKKFIIIIVSRKFDYRFYYKKALITIIYIKKVNEINTFF